MSRPRPACGTDGGYRSHRRHGEDACPDCLRAHADHNRTSDRPRAIAEDACGSYRGYMRHYRNNEDACFGCRVAAAEYKAEQRRSAAA